MVEGEEDNEEDEEEEEEDILLSSEEDKEEEDESDEQEMTSFPFTLRRSADPSWDWGQIAVDSLQEGDASKCIDEEDMRYIDSLDDYQEEVYGEEELSDEDDACQAYKSKRVHELEYDPAFDLLEAVHAGGEDGSLSPSFQVVLNRET